MVEVVTQRHRQDVYLQNVGAEPEDPTLGSKVGHEGREKRVHLGDGV